MANNIGIIYKWTNKINGLSYIGQTTNPEKRYREHLRRKDNTYFHNALGKYGEANFTYEVLESNIDSSKLDEREIYWISYYDSYNNGYNLTIGGGTTRGFKFSEKQLENLSKAHLGQKAWNKGIKMSEEQREKMRNYLKGRTSPMKGKHHTEQTIQKMRESHKGQVAWNKQPIQMIDKKTDEVIKEFDSLADAANYLGKSHSGISQCLSGRLKTAYGYKWNKITKYE